MHNIYVIVKGWSYLGFALFLLNACLSQNLYISSVFFSRCNNTCTSFSKYYIIKQLSPRSILVLSGRYHIISNASLVNNCIILVIINKCNYMVVMKCQREKGGTLTTVMVDHFSVDHVDHVDHTDTFVINVTIVGKYKLTKSSQIRQ